MTEEKLVPELRFQEFEGEWEKEKLGTIAKIKTGNSNVQDSVKNGKYNFFDRSVDIKKMNKFDYDEEAIIYPGEGSQFFPQYYKGKYALHQRAYSITSDKIDMRYLNYMLMQRNNHFLRMAVGSTVKSLRMDNFEKCPIYLTVKAEQEKIGGFFSKIDKKIELQEQLIENLEEQKKGLMQKIFNQEVRFKDENGKDYPEWEKKRLGDISESVGGRPLEKYVSSDSNYKFISIGNYSINGKYFDNGQRVEYNEFTKDRLLNKNDIAMVLNDKTKTGDIIGSSILINASNKYIYNQRTQRIIFQKDKVNYKYIWFYLNNYKFRKEVFRRSQGGTQIYINFSEVEKIKIDLPSKKEQNKIAGFLSLADKRIDLEKEQLENYKEYKKGLMQRMFI